MARKPTLELPDYVFRTKAKERYYYYFQRGRGTKEAGQRYRLPEDPHSPVFWEKYRELTGQEAPKINPRSFNFMIDQFEDFDNPDLTDLAAATRRQYQRHCKLFRQWWGPLEVSGLSPKNVIKRRDDMKNTPAEANAMLRSLSALISWSVPRGFRDDNPCEFVPMLKTGDGYEPWPWDMIDWSQEHCPEWMRNAIILALYTGQRQGDVLAMQWGQIQDDMITVRQSKTGIKLLIPLHRELRAALSQMPKKAITILTNSRGRAWTPDGFRSSWQKAQPDRLKESGLVFHGLRKSAVVTLLEAGCTDGEVAAVTGQSRQMVEHYAKQVNQKKMARAAILRWEQS